MNPTCPALNFWDLSHDQAVIEADHANLSPLESSDQVRNAVSEIYNNLIAESEKATGKG